MKRLQRILSAAFGASLLIGAIYLFYTHSHEDTKGPVLSADSTEIKTSISATDEDIAAGVTAIDDLDGDVSDSILIESIKKNEAGEDHEFIVTYAAFDHSNNAGELERTLYYEDYISPRFSLTRQLRFPENQKFNLFDYVHADDCIDGDVSPFITIKDNAGIPENPQKGIYNCTLQVTNSVGDSSELPVQIEIYESSYEESTLRPEIMLSENLVYLNKGDAFDPSTYLAYVTDQGTKQIDITGNASETESSGRKIPVQKIGITSNVDVNTPGVYSAVYTYRSEQTGYDCSAVLLVVVE